MIAVDGTTLRAKNGTKKVIHVIKPRAKHAFEVERECGSRLERVAMDPQERAAMEKNTIQRSQRARWALKGKGAAPHKQKGRQKLFRLDSTQAGAWF